MHSITSRTPRVGVARSLAVAEAREGAGGPRVPVRTLARYAPTGHGTSSAPPADLVAITSRPAVRERIRAVASMMGLRPPRFVERPSELVRPWCGERFLLLDLAACCRDGTLCEAVRTWAARSGGGELLLFAPLSEREEEVRIAVAIARVAPRARVHVITNGEFFADETWRRLGIGCDCTRMEACLRADLDAAIRAIGGRIRAERVVFEILHDAAGGAWGDTVESESSALCRARQTRWRWLRRDGQMPASVLMPAFRVLWFLALRDAGCSADRAAMVLGAGSVRNFRRIVRRRLALSFRDLRRVSLSDGVAWMAAILTSDHSTRQGRMARHLGGMLVGRDSEGGIQDSGRIQGPES